MLTQRLNDGTLDGDAFASVLASEDKLHTERMCLLDAVHCSLAIARWLSADPVRDAMLACIPSAKIAMIALCCTPSLPRHDKQNYMQDNCIRLLNHDSLTKS